MRGHRCSYRIKLTQRLGFVNFWFVEELGSHDQLNRKDCDFKANSQIASAMAESDAVDLSHSLKVKLPNIPKSHRKLAPKPLTKQTAEKTRAKSDIDRSVSDPTADVPTSYHYVLGSISNGSPSRESLSHMSPSQTGLVMDTFPNSSSSQSCAIDPYKGLIPASLQANSQVLPACLQPVSLNSMNPILQANLVNYMSSMTNLGLNASLQNGLNPFLVNIKEEPGDDRQNILSYAAAMPGLPSHLHFPSSQSQSPVHHSRSHSPSPSRGQEHTYRDRSPLYRDQSPNHGIQKGLELEAKIKKEAYQKMQAHHDTLGQVHNRLMERAKSRKSSHTVRVPPKSESEVVDLSRSKTENKHDHNQCASNNSIVDSPLSNMAENGDSSSFSSLAFQRLKALNHVIRSDVFQNAKSQLEKKKVIDSLNKGTNDEEAALNLVVNQRKDKVDSPGRSYFLLAEEWKKGRESGDSSAAEGQIRSTKTDQSTSLVNGEIGDLGELLQTDKLTKNEKELVCRVRQLEAHVKQLQNIVIKKDISTSQPVTGRKRIRPPREIDFNKFNTRHVALKVMYLGFDYTGFAGLEETENTIERTLFDALKKTRLIESEETTVTTYAKCGRTDKSVSAFSQVISLDLRSNLLSGVGVKVREGGTAHERADDKSTEIRYCHILNKNLPREIRVLAWAPVDPSFNARFNCKKRTYKYFFPRGELSIEVMNEAAKRLIGEHDFRNFCKLNVKDGVITFVRNVFSAEVRPLTESESGYAMCELTIVANAFLWHQIRCIASILFLIGRGKEEPKLIDELFDVEKVKGRPQFPISSGIPLCLYNADYEDEFEWVYEADWHEDNIKTLQQMWAEHSIKATMLKSMLDDLDKAKVETECDIAPWSDLSPPLQYQSSWICIDSYRNHKPLLERPTCMTVEERIESVQAKKRKLEYVDEDFYETGESSTKVSVSEKTDETDESLDKKPTD